ncbi:hypothetical protein SAMN06298216_3777 [Spirosomataceae bacterium TFI 002]|nr:hypothetical protein SAMN06298216_3777 [Spirosomataceae bacterium TFI 002]
MNPKTAIKIMLFLVLAIILFHFCIVLKIVPYEITWGGRLKNDTEMYVFESISIIINLLLFSILLIKGKYIRELISMKAVNITLWAFFVLFGLNTIGNIIAKTNFEKFFALLTFAFSLLIWMILRKENKR